MGESFENLGLRWYVVHTYTGYENRVKANIEKIIENRGLEDIIKEVKVPSEIVAKTTDKGIKETEEKLFPAYVFVKMVMSDFAWHIVRHCQGVTGFVGPGSKPVPLSEKEVEEMNVEGETILELDFAVGDGVKVKSGMFVGFVGVVQSISENRKKANILVSMFGRETPAEIDTTELEKLDLG